MSGNVPGPEIAADQIAVARQVARYNLLAIPVEVAAIRETTALGAASLAGLGVELWRSTKDLEQRRAVAARYEPRMSADERETLYAGWRRAVERAREWVI